MFVLFLFPEFNQANKYTVKWNEEKIPFIVLNRKVYDCQHGKDRDASKKLNRQEKKVS